MMREKLLELKARNLPELGVGGYGSRGGFKPRSGASSSAISASAGRPSERDSERDREHGYSDRRDYVRSNDRVCDRHRDDRDRHDRNCAHPRPRAAATPLHQAVLAASQMTRGIATVETSMTDASSGIATGGATAGVTMTNATGATISKLPQFIPDDTPLRPPAPAQVLNLVQQRRVYRPLPSSPSCVDWRLQPNRLPPLPNVHALGRLG